jgi:hypothetical protein
MALTGGYDWQASWMGQDSLTNKEVQLIDV